MKDTINFGRSARESERTSANRTDNKGTVLAWNFQPTGATWRAGASTLRDKNRSAFRTLGNSFFDEEAPREDWIEGLVFGLIAALSAWPMFSAAQALFHLMK